MRGGCSSFAALRMTSAGWGCCVKKKSDASTCAKPPAHCHPERSEGPPPAHCHPERSEGLTPRRLSSWAQRRTCTPSIVILSAAKDLHPPNTHSSPHVQIHRACRNFEPFMESFQRVTEQPSRYDHLEQMSVSDILRNINSEDKIVPLSVENALPDTERLPGALAEIILAGGRLFYIGAGTRGRLGVASFNTPPSPRY